MRAASTVLYHSAILSNWPVRRTKWAYLAGLIGCVAGARWRTFVMTSFIAGSPLVRAGWRAARSEEHTSELQSRFDLVCRLLLEKKKAQSDNRLIDNMRFSLSPHVKVDAFRPHRP